MKRIAFATTALTILSSTAALAAGIERSSQSADVLFESGTYMEFGLNHVSPDVSGAGTGSVAEDHTRYNAAYKADIDNQVSFALVFDQPFGADVAYPTGTGHAMAGSAAELNSDSFTGLLRYKFDSNISLIGGLRYQTFEAKGNITSAGGGYSFDGGKEGGFGYVLGAAYETSTFRAALTYNSKIKTDHDVTENSAALGAGRASTLEVETPQSINVDLQTKLSENQVLFGGLRWVNWSDFDINPADYNSISGGPLLGYEDDSIIYTVGMSQQINDQLSIMGALSYEDGTGSPASNLTPREGALGISAGAKYKLDATTFSAGVQYTMLEDANTGLSSFNDNDELGFELKVGYHF